MYNIAVIGCGAIGLTSALEIQNKLGNRAKVTIFADKFSPNTTSDIAAGFWEPYLVADNVEEDIIRWSKDTYQYILQLWKNGEAKHAGICLQPAINLQNCKNYEIPNWVSVTLGYNELSERHLETLSKQYKRSFTGGFMFVSFTWEGTIFLPYLQKKFLKGKGTIIERHVDRFNELEEFDVIVNCTGIEARNLSSDEAVVPIRGQIMRVIAPWQKIIYITDSEEEEDTCYIIPNINSVVLGGTKQESYDTLVNQNDSSRILKNVSKICPSMADSKILTQVVGLRPSRFRVRLEEEFVQLDRNKTLKIVHNYGHGGSGITLCIGCAKDTVSLVEKIIKTNQSKI